MAFPKSIALCLLGLAAAATVDTATAATTGTIKFSGRIDPGTCDLSVGDVDREITLDPVKVGDFDTSNSAAPKDFELTAGCESGVSTVTFTFSGTPYAGDASRFSNTGTASGVGLWLYSRVGGGTPVTISPAAPNNVATVPVSAGVARLPLGAAYYRVGAVGTVTSGSLTSTATVNITYR